MDDLKTRIKKVIRLACGLDNDCQIGDDDVLFGDDSSMDLDSIDILGIVTGMEVEFDIEIGDREEIEGAFKSVNSLEEYLKGKGVK